jgi:hypothetical protein
VPKPHPDHDASRENLTRLSNDLDSLDELVRGLIEPSLSSGDIGHDGMRIRIALLVA